MTESMPVNGYEFAKRSVYGGYPMRSKVEVEVAMTLDRWQIQWTYEQQPFHLADGVNYLPDFAIHADPAGVLDGVRFVEVKGHGDLFPFAKALGLGNNTTTRKTAPIWDQGLTWTPLADPREPQLLAPLTPLLKPYLLACASRSPVLVLTNPTINSAVVRFTDEGNAEARRAHPLMARRYEGGDVRTAAAQHVAAAR